MSDLNKFKTTLSKIKISKKWSWIAGSIIGASLLINLLAFIFLGASLSFKSQSPSINPTFSRLNSSFFWINRITPTSLVTNVVFPNSFLADMNRIGQNVSHIESDFLSNIHPILKKGESASSLLTKANLEKITGFGTRTDQRLAAVKLNISQNNSLRSLISKHFPSLLNKISDGMNLSSLASISDQIAGCTTPKRFVIFLLSPSEQRAIGGLIGQYIQVQINCGKIKIEKIGANTDLKDTDIFLQLYAKHPDLFVSGDPSWVDSNTIIDGPGLGSEWVNAYEKQMNLKIDGTLAIDVRVLAELVPLSGSITTGDGKVLKTPAEIEAYLLNGVYFQFTTDQIARKNHQVAITQEMAKSLSADKMFSSAALQVFYRSMQNNRFFLYLADPKAEATIAKSSYSYSVGTDPSVIYVGINNYSGSKFDFYSNYSTQLADCGAGDYVLHFTISNSADPKETFPDYVARRLDSVNTTAVGVANQILIEIPKGMRYQYGHIPASADGGELTNSDGSTTANIVNFIDAGSKSEYLLKIHSRNRPVVQVWNNSLVYPANLGSQGCQIPQ